MGGECTCCGVWWVSEADPDASKWLVNTITTELPTVMWLVVSALWWEVNGVYVAMVVRVVMIHLEKVRKKDRERRWHLSKRDAKWGRSDGGEGGER